MSVLLFYVLLGYITGMELSALAALLEQHHAAHQWLRDFTLPEEDRRTFTSAPSSSYRWFRSENVIDLDAVRALMRKAHVPPL
jgi:hypothetical protein